MVVFLAKLRTICACFIRMIVTGRLSISGHAYAFRLNDIHSVFRPTVDEGNNFPRRYGAITCQVLRMEFRTRCLVHLFNDARFRRCEAVVKDRQFVCSFYECRDGSFHVLL